MKHEWWTKLADMTNPYDKETPHDFQFWVGDIDLICTSQTRRGKSIQIRLRDDHPQAGVDIRMFGDLTRLTDKDNKLHAKKHRVIWRVKSLAQELVSP